MTQNHNNLTWRELNQFLDGLSESELDDNVTISDGIVANPETEFYPVHHIARTSESDTDALDPGALVLVSIQ